MFERVTIRASDPEASERFYATVLEVLGFGRSGARWADFEVAAAKYFHALRDGEIPLLLLFSGTVFYRGDDGMLVDQIPWDREVSATMAYV